MTHSHSHNVNFFHDYKKLPYPRKSLNDTAKKIVQMEKILIKKKSNVILCSDYKIRKLNKKYRSMDKPTDVLSFPFDDDDFLGEIYISLQRTKIQAKRYSLTYTEEVKRLFIHGIFHLLGYDHKNDRERSVMESLEKQYF